MTHPRQVVRDAFALAVTGLALTGSRVHKARRYPLTELPALKIFTPRDERADDVLEDNALPSMRLVDVICEACAQQTGEVEDIVDAICEQVEQAIDADQTLGGEVQTTVYQQCDVVLDDTGEQPIVVARMRFQAVL